MKRIPFIQSDKQVRVTLAVKGDSLTAYSMRLWNKKNDTMQLIKELRGSCIHEGMEEFLVDVSECNEYFVELSANINTTQPSSNFIIQLSVKQKNQKNVEVTLDEEIALGQIGYEDGGKYKALGVALVPSKINEAVESPAA